MAPIPEQFMDYHIYPTREDARVNAGVHVDTFQVTVRDRGELICVYINLFKDMFEDINDLPLYLYRTKVDSWMHEHWRTYCERNQKQFDNFRMLY